jgi:ATP-dependent exoDNAse (exonuclease V) beta subunit
MSLEVYRSSAGSGKTTTLVRKYLSVVLASENPEAFRQVLAITFTNKAAGEMKERVLQALSELSHPESHPKASILQWAEDFCEEQELDMNALKVRAAATLSRILHRYSDFSVSTIDKFSHRIIRQFAFDLGVSSDFKVELDTGRLIEDAVQALIERTGSEHVLTRFLVSFIINKAEDEKGWNIERDIAQLGFKLFDEASVEPLKRLRSIDLEQFLKVRNEMAASVEKFIHKLTEGADEVLALVSAHGLGAEDFSYGEKSGFVKQLRKISNGDLSPLPGNAFAKYAAGEGFFKKEQMKMERFSSLVPIFAESAQGLLKAYEAGADEFVRFSALLPRLFALGSLLELDKELRRIAHDENLIPISEFNRMISATVKDQPAPYIYERMGEKYQHIFIDEFQDTSRMQWQNLVPLVDHILSSGGSALLVGDAKQSIYRWRGGEAQQFQILPDVPGHDRISQERSLHFRSHFTLKSLDDNYRSAPEIVNFNNIFFEHIKQSHIFPGMEVYSDVEQNPKSRIASGAVWLHPMHEARDLNADESSEKVLEAILDFVNITRAEHETMLREITILTRKRSEGSVIASYLLSHGIPVISPESILINRSHKVNSLVAGLQHLSQADDGPAALTWMYSSETHPVIASHLPEEGPEFYELKSLYYKSDSPLAVVHALCKFRGWSPADDIFLQFFFDRIADYEMNSLAPSCSDFIVWWLENESKFNVILPDGMDAVQIMTIHKSKGLQFPVVIFPFVDFSTKLMPDTVFWVPLEAEKNHGLSAGLVSSSAKTEEFSALIEEEENNNLMDSLNLLYVAFTRACNHLALIPSYPNRGKSSKISSWIDSFVAAHASEQEPFGDWLVFGHADAALREEVEAVSSTPQQDVLTYKLHSPVWAKPEYSFNAYSMARTEGIQMHEQLAILALGGQISDPEVQRLWQDISHHPSLTEAFREGAKFFSERELSDDQGEILRPDLIIENKDVYYIIDYKTGHPEDIHPLQVREYIRALESAGHRVSAAWLVYIGEGVEVVEVKG